MPKKTLIMLAAFLLLAIALYGCSGPDQPGQTAILQEQTEEQVVDDDEETAEVETSLEKDEPETDDHIQTGAIAQELNAGLGRDPGIQYGYGAHPPLTRVLETLVGRDVELSHIPGLAKSWDVSDDGLSWTLYLQEDVKFHDGTDFDAEAVKHNLIRVSGTSPDLFGEIDSINVIDEYTIEINHSAPFAPFLYSLAWPGAAMISPSAIDEEGKVIEPIGTGPYKRVEWVPEEKMVLERNEDYWAGMPLLEKITLNNIPDATTRLLALEAGEIDMIIDTGGVLPEHVAMLETNPEVKILMMDGAVPHYMSLNTAQGPLSDVDVRKAIMHAIDPEDIIIYALEGYGKVMTSIVPHSEAEWLHKDVLYQFDEQQKALELLEGAGWTDSDQDGVLDKQGEEFNITFLLSTSLIGRWPYLTIAEIIQDQLGDIGIIVEIKVVEGGLWSQDLKEGKADLSIRPWAGISPQTRLQAWLHSEGEQNLAMGINLSNPEIDSLIEQALATTDQSSAIDLLYEVQELAAQEVSVIPIYDEVLINAVNKKIGGYELHPWFHVNWEDIYVSDESGQ